MTLAELAARLAPADGVGEADYSDEGMLQYLARNESSLPTRPRATGRRDGAHLRSPDFPPGLKPNDPAPLADTPKEQAGWPDETRVAH